MLAGFPQPRPPSSALEAHWRFRCLACVATLGEYGAASRRTSGRVVALAGLSAVGFECPFFRHHPHSTSYLDLLIPFGSHKKLFGTRDGNVEIRLSSQFGVFVCNHFAHFVQLYIVRSICLEGQTFRLGPAV